MISNNGHDERGKYSGGAAGDQTGGEWARIKWYSRPWTVVLRHPDRSVGNLIARLAGEAADNNKIGYDQNQRRTFYEQLKKAGWYPRLITTACEADCSAGVAAIVIAAGHILGNDKLKAVSPDMYTGNERAALTAAGFTALTDSKYLTSDQYLLPGDILLYDGHHTAINLDTGSKAIMPTYNIETHISIVAGRLPVLRAQGYVHGDSHSYPPNCPATDRITSCDREAVAYPLYKMGFTDQPGHGLSVMNMEPWLLGHGWKKITDQNSLRRGDIVLMRNASMVPNAMWHTFLVTGFRNAGDLDKYDFGSTSRWMNDNQPYSHVPLNQWTGVRWFYCAFRYGSGSGEDYLDVTPEALSAGTKSKWAYKATEILQARGCKGITDKATGRRKELQNNFEWSIGDMAAAAEFRMMRACEGQSDLVKENAPAGNFTMLMWQVAFGGGFPFRLYPVPEKQTKGLTVLKIQETLRARDILGADGKPVKLDREWGPNTEFAFREYQRRRGGPVDGKCSVRWLKDMFGL